MAKIILDDVGNFNSTGLGTINSNSDQIEQAFENTLSRDGTSPNQMTADFDMNGNDIINVDNVNANHIIADDFTLGDGQSFQDYIDQAKGAAEDAQEAADEAGVTLGEVQELAEDVEDAAASVVIKSVSSRTDLLALDESVTKLAFLSEEGREGTFDWISDGYDLRGKAVSTTSVDTGTNTFTRNNHGLFTGQAVVMTAASTDLSLNTIYYFIKKSDSTFQLATSYSNAISGTAIDITSSSNVNLRQHTDPTQAIYVFPDSDVTGRSGVWVRRTKQPIKVSWAGASSSKTSTQNSEAYQGAIDVSPEGGVIDYQEGHSLAATIYLPYQLRHSGRSTKGTVITIESPVGFETASTLTNGPTNAPIFEDMTIRFKSSVDQDAVLVKIRGGNSFSTFRRVRFEEDTETEFYAELSDVSGTFEVSEEIEDSNTWTGEVLEVSSTQLRFNRTDDEGFANLIAPGETITGSTSGATATVLNLSKRYHTVGVQYVSGSAEDFSDEMRPSVYGVFIQCEFFGMKIGSEFKYGNYKRANETQFYGCSWQFVDYAIYDAQQTSDVKIFGGGVEIWNKTAIYSDGYHFKVFGTRFERGGVGTETPLKYTFAPSQVSTNGDYLSLGPNTIPENAQVVIESRRRSGNRNDPIWPEGLNPGTIYYWKYRNVNSGYLCKSPNGTAVNITSTGYYALGFNTKSGTFSAGETVTGSTSGATGTVADFDGGDTSGNLYFSASSGTFQTGETITGGTSGATAKATGKAETFTLRVLNNIAMIFGTHSDECSVLLPQKQIGGGDTFIVWDGRRATDYGTDTFLYKEHMTEVEEIPYSTNPMRTIKAGTGRTTNLEEVYGPSGDLTHFTSFSGQPSTVSKNVFASVGKVGGVLTLNADDTSMWIVDVDDNISGGVSLSGGSGCQILTVVLRWTGDYDIIVGDSGSSVYMAGGAQTISDAGNGDIYVFRFQRNSSTGKWYEIGRAEALA